MGGSSRAVAASFQLVGFSRVIFVESDDMAFSWQALVARVNRGGGR